ncbi:elongation factor P maturation arginine rhamnosyltransferase EarP [Neisseria bacilliformis]|uniref:elongation factor P maturation arginine rhamnosyltransferase EarP n=1 Tax=Neisseria bacilliformis TaxID=267212 RepID=UPI0028EC8EA4|nr:elongation factor P maturation arginine rhamnosyltransferase EarP [Neisseria bacilliformis]
MNTSPSCHIFCTVIDNFGDIGVSWRLARILQNECRWRVTLWLDDEAALRALCPGLPALPCHYRDTDLRLWREGGDMPQWDETADIVIETFGCNLPEDVKKSIARQKALWLNWEYLSAEEWAAAMHGKPSPQADGTEKFFWLMGFDERGGGLLREKNYTELCRCDPPLFRRQLGLPERNAPEWLLFGYRSGVWADWLRTWQAAGEAMTLLLCGTQVADSLKQSGIIPQECLNRDGDVFQTACVRLARLPFVPQHDFDRLLHLSDGLIVRGEDSFVRAQLAGKPFFWHIYPQDEMAHLDKLSAFWQKVYPLFPPEAAATHRALSEEINGKGRLKNEERLAHWLFLNEHMSAWRQAAQAWRQKLFAQPTAAEKLANFIKRR